MQLILLILLGLLASQSVQSFVAVPHEINTLFPSQFRTHHMFKITLYDRRDDDEASNNNIVVEAIDGAVSLASKPTPGLPDLALGFPIVLLLQFALVPVPQALLSIVLFAALRTSARSLIILEETSDKDVYGISVKEEGDDNNEEEESILNIQIDFVSIILSIFSAGLLTPQGAADANGSDALMMDLPNVLFAICLLGLTAVLLGTGVDQVQENEQLSKDDKLLNTWDQRFRKQQKAQRKGKTPPGED